MRRLAATLIVFVVAAGCSLKDTRTRPERGEPMAETHNSELRTATVDGVRCVLAELRTEQGVAIDCDFGSDDNDKP